MDCRISSANFNLGYLKSYSNRYNIDFISVRIGIIVPIIAVAVAHDGAVSPKPLIKISPITDRVAVGIWYRFLPDSDSGAERSVMSGRTGRAIIYPWGLMEPGDSFVADTLKNGIVRRNRTALTRRYGRFFVERDLPGLGVTRVWCAAYVPGASPYRDPNNRLQLCTVVEKGDPVPADLMAGVTEMMRRGVITMPRAKYDWAGLKVGGSIRMAASAGGVRSRLSELSLRYGKLFTVRPCEDGAGCIVWCVGKVGEAPTIDVPVVRRGRRTKVEMDPGLLGYAQQLGALKPGEVVSLTGTWERISLARKHVVKKTNYLFSSTTKSFHKRTGSVRVTRVE